MDELKKFINNNREEFDGGEPRGDLWMKIRQDLKQPEPKRRWLSEMKVWKAAAVILLLTTSWLVFDRLSSDDSQVATQQVAQPDVLSEFSEVENYYMMVVSEKRKLLEQAASDDPEYKKEFLSELEDLDSQYNQLKENLKFGNQEEVISALIINLQLRIEILNKQLEIIQNINKRENETVI